MPVPDFRPAPDLSMKKNIKIRIFGTMERGEGDDPEKESVKIEGDGVMALDGERLTVCYDEFMDENEHVKCTISFDVGEPSVVTLVREGAVHAVLTFSEQARYSGKYDLGFAEMQVTVSARRVANGVTFDHGGTLFLDYSTEVQGVALQTARFRFEISPVSTRGRRKSAE